MSTVGATLMVKNEQDKLYETFLSVKDVVDCFIVLDTGSTDKTIEQIEQYCVEFNKKLYITKKEFPKPFHFSNARNELLSFADDKADYLLLLDASDVLRDPNHLKQFMDTYSGPAKGFYLTQEWCYDENRSDKYSNIRMIKTKCRWNYKGSIHEYITTDNLIQSDILKLPSVVIFQDRRKYGSSSRLRFFNDEEILEKEFQTNLELFEKGETKEKYDGRNLFYYAQTCVCLGKTEKAYTLYKLRSQMDGFIEEKFLSAYNCGTLSYDLKFDWEITINWYLKAYEISCSQLNTPRAEPLYRIAEYYKDRCNELCYIYIRRCCELQFPHTNTLFVNTGVYEYDRWHLAGIISYYVKDFKLGREGCIQAILSSNKEIDRNNLKFYLNDKENIDDVIGMSKKY